MPSLAQREKGRLRAGASRRPAVAETALGRAKALREARYAVLLTEASGGRVPSDDLQTVCDTVAQAMAKRSLAWDGNRFTWCWSDRGDLDAVSHRVAFAAARMRPAARIVESRASGQSGRSNWGYRLRPILNLH